MLEKQVPIDVIIPVFNCEKYLEAAVGSVVKQTLKPNKIFICNDGSTDKTLEIAKELASKNNCIKVLDLEHRGVSAARNAGIIASCAEVIAFLDADDLWVPEKLEEQYKIFQLGNEHISLVHSSYENINEEGGTTPNGSVVPPQKRGDIFDDLLFDQYVLSGSASSSMVRRKYLDQVGLFDENLFFGEDLDLWLRLSYISEVDFSPKPLVQIRVHNGSVQRQNSKEKIIDFSMQILSIYDKWQQEISKRAGFKNQLKTRNLEQVFPAFIHPLNLYNIEKFYKELNKSGHIGPTLFKSRLDLWLSIFLLGISRLKKKFRDAL